MNKSPTEKEELFWDTAEIHEIDGFWYYAERNGTHGGLQVAIRVPKRRRLSGILSQNGHDVAQGALPHHPSPPRPRRGRRHLDEEEPAPSGPHALEFSFLLGRVQHLLLSPRRRLMHTHLPYSYLPEEVTRSPAAAAGCRKLVYLARNPKDTVVSMWHFYNQVHKATGSAGPLSVERAVESFCSGVMPWGPFYEHVLGYWEESKKRPDEVLFLKYEELCGEPKEQVRKLASFLGRSFPSTTDGSVEKVLWRSSFGRLKELEVNKYGAVGEQGLHLSHTIYFRKGTVGDWKNYLTSDMARCIDQVTQNKLLGTGLSLDDFLFSF
ncbi:unnamed protein product [Linum tenue]|uniref:Sulfotransferase n=1 Tax=Linum tenue TaxID=586396 RepID=A0AAV0PP00_9ROSI|nr:unnamed protein product [Linum tenue]